MGRKKKVLLSKNEVLQLLKEMKSNNILDNVRVGLVGSFARGNNKKSSDINILISYAAGINDIEIYEYILHFMKNRCNYKIDIIHLESVKTADEELDEYSISIGFPPVSEISGSDYERLLKEVRWIE